LLPSLFLALLLFNGFFCVIRVALYPPLLITYTTLLFNRSLIFSIHLAGLSSILAAINFLVLVLQ
jgi:heme/copper-type cytochrome/quinol oxidase subunit 1